MMQSVRSNGGIVHPVGVPPAGPTSISLQSVEPWSNTQLCPPPVTGSAGLLCSKTELSGTKIEPAVPVKRPGDQLTVGGWGKTKPPGGNVEPSAQTAQAKFWQRNVNAAAVATTCRVRFLRFALPHFRIMVYFLTLENTDKVLLGLSIQPDAFFESFVRSCAISTRRRSSIRAEKTSPPGNLCLHVLAERHL